MDTANHIIATLNSKIVPILKTRYAQIGIGVLLVGLLMLWLFFGRHTSNAETVELKIRPGETYDVVLSRLDSLGVKPPQPAFAVFSRLKSGSDDHRFRSGRYLVQPHTSALDLVRMLTRGQEAPIRLTLGKYRTAEQLSAYLGRVMMEDSAYWRLKFSDSTLLADCGVDTVSLLSLFVPNTYEVYWSMTGEKLLHRMRRESDNFWTDSRKQKAQQAGLTPYQAVVLASIVEEETNKNDEKPLVASVYLNRLRKGMLLQADPTVKYAVGDFALKRILNVHLTADSPYNTYLYKGLPIGPICTPSVSSIDAVLQNRQTTYLYFCAKEDFSGYHNFASTLSQHNANAARFHKALNAKGIK